MPGLGTIINVALIVVGGLAGLLVGKFIKQNIQDSLMIVCGVSTIFIAIGGALKEMFVIEDGVISTQGSMMMIITLCVGTLVGELLKLCDKLEKFGEWLKLKTGNAKDARFVNAFVTASLTVCVGAMAIVGSIKDGIELDPSILIAKGILDLVIIAVMAASMGKGAIFSAIPVALLQGVVTILARLISPVLTEAALSNISLTGSVIIFCVGINLIWNKNIRVANMLPALIFAGLWSLIG